MINNFKEMRNIIAALVLFLAITGLKAQTTPASFPKDSAQWITYYFNCNADCWAHTQPEEHYYDCYQMKGDTLINSVPCKKLTRWTCTKYISLANTISYSYSGAAYSGVLHYDTITKGLYYAAPNDTAILMYRFGLEAGDNYVTPWSAHHEMNADSLVSRTVDSLFISYPLRSNATFSGFFHYMYWPKDCYWSSDYNGVMSMAGPVYGLLGMDCQTEIGYSRLDCFTNLGTSAQKCFAITDGKLVTGIDEAANVSPAGAYPNPADKEFTFTTYQESSSEKFNISITDLFGNAVYTCNNVSSGTTIKTEMIANGIYLLRMENNKLRSAQKLIINH